MGTATLAVALTAGSVRATPSTNIWNPTTDIEGKRGWHLDIDDYFSVFKNNTKPVHAPTDVGLLYGLGTGFEVGIDVDEPVAYPVGSPVYLNAKWGLPATKKIPVDFAVGVQNLGFTKASNQMIGYMLVSKTWDKPGRFTLGGYYGMPNVLRVNTVGGRTGDNAGIIAAWDRNFGKKWWGSVDIATGQNTYGEASAGAEYKFTKDIGVIFGYVQPMSRGHVANGTFTTQLDVDF
jgi:hypothetical protein